MKTPTSLSDRVITWRLFCPRRGCSFKARIQAREDQIHDHTSLVCPRCRVFGLDAIDEGRLRRRARRT